MQNSSLKQFKADQLTEENSIEIAAKEMYDDCKMAIKSGKIKARTLSQFLLDNGLSTGVLSNSVRNYWYKHTPGAVRTDWGDRNKQLRAFQYGHVNGLIKTERYDYLCELFKFDRNKYLLNKPEPEEKEKPKAVAPVKETEIIYTSKYEDDLKEIKELLKEQNKLLSKLVKELS